ncbi:MAG: hypothetical protein KatS3mg115_0406 [Candidatus Poribacteria bacterium]|nr:MAG: hypothetical protein KatS3mg115_0406 [Candidatus Poribacteria bacterium]
MRANWKFSDLVALYLTTMVVALSLWTVLAIALGPARTASRPEELLAAAQEPESAWILATLLAGALTLLSLWVLGNRFRWTLPELGLHTFRLVEMVTLGVVVGAVAFGFGLLVLLAVGWLIQGSASTAMLLRVFPVRATDPLWVLIVPTLLVLNPLGAELFFRGMFYRYARARWRPRVALWVTALFFALASGTIGPTASLVLLGAVNCLLFERTGSLVPGIAANSTLGLAMVLWALIQQATLGL